MSVREMPETVRSRLCVLSKLNSLYANQPDLVGYAAMLCSYDFALYSGYAIGDDGVDADCRFIAQETFDA